MHVLDISNNKEKGKIEGIQIIIKILKDFNMPEKEIIKRVMQNYNISKKEVQKYLD